MYDPTTAVAHHVTVNEEHGMLFPEGFANDKPNVINYADVAGKTIKMDRAGGYKPTADAPLVIKVDAGVDTIRNINIEGWSSSASADQALARYILVDLSQAADTVTIDGLEMGALWAPASSIAFNSGVITNGQWFVGGNVSTAGGGEVHHHRFMGNLLCDLPEQPTDPVVPVDPAVPSIGTTVAVEGSTDKVLSLEGGVVVDAVAYEGLTPGVEYTLEGELRVAPSGEDTGLKASATFAAEAAEGVATVSFTLSAEDVAAYAGRDLVVFEYLFLDGEKVAEHADPLDEAQTFTVEDEPVVPVDPAVPTDPTDPVDPEDPTDPEGGLAQTGSTVVWPVTAGLLLVMAGLVALLSARRKA